MRVVGLGLLAMGCCLAACSEPEPAESGSLCQGIVGGTSSPTLVPLSSARQRAIVSVSVPATGTENGGTCAGVMIAPRSVLTARHCADPDGDSRASAGLTLSVTSPEGHATQLAIDEAWLHPSLDVALLEASGLDSQELALDPIPPNWAALDESWVRSPVEIAGHGETLELDEFGLRFAVEPIERVEPELVVITGSGKTGACVGDSGGPLLARTDDGQIRAVGILDSGDATCRGLDMYTRIDLLLEWQPIARLMRASPAPPTACEGLSHVGICLRGRAMWCHEDRVATQACNAPGQVCGWNTAAGGFRCVARNADPCHGLGSFRHCDADRVVACAAGTLVTQHCDACAQHCRPWSDGSGAGCL
jgi:hypothetical protein